MEFRNEHDSLLILYLLNEVSADEKIQIEEWINENEENKKYFEEKKLQLAFVKEKVDEIDVGDEWKEFRNIVVSKQQPVAQEEDHLTADEDHVLHQERKKTLYIRKFVVATAVAASLFLVFLFSGQLIKEQGSVKKKASALAVKDSVRENILFRHESNTSGKTKMLLLKDGSQIKLWNNTEVTYMEPFTGNKRDVFLKGKAEFIVAANRSKPFTVYSGDISTTALGTNFVVTAYDSENHINVRLYKGKIVVKSVESVARKLDSSYYLEPGQELVYNTKAITAKLRKFNLKNLQHGSTANEEYVEETPSLPHFTDDSWYMFNNQSLSDIFDQLAVIHGVKIDYSKSDIDKKRLIGIFNKSDTLEEILNKIATLHNLTVTKEKDRFIIKNNSKVKK